MGYRLALIVLQALGALSIIPYPAVLVANVMQIAADRPPGTLRFLREASPFALLSLYPLVWLVLDMWAWRAFTNGALGRAFLLSSIPAVATLAGAIWLSSNSAGH